MAGKLRQGPLSLKEQRELIAMAASGASVSELAARFRTSTEAIERKARTLGIRLKGRRVEIGLKAKK
jgi:hypothetical protein